MRPSAVVESRLPMRWSVMEWRVPASCSVLRCVNQGAFSMPRFDKSPLKFRSSSVMEEPADDSDVIDSNEIRVVGNNDNTIFVIRLGEDGRSIEVRKFQGVVIDLKYHEELAIQPRASNVVELRLVSDAG